MDGFKNTTKMKYMTGGQVVAPAKPMSSMVPAPQSPVSSPQGAAGKANVSLGALRLPTPTPQPVPTKSGPIRGAGPKPDTRGKGKTLPDNRRLVGVSKLTPAGLSTDFTKRMAHGGKVVPPPKTKTPIKPSQPKPVPHPTVVNPIRPGRPVINPNPPVKPKPVPHPTVVNPIRPGRPVTNPPVTLTGPPIPPAPTGGSTPLPTPRSGYSKGGSAKKGVPAHSGKPMIGRKASGLTVMPKGKCK